MLTIEKLFTVSWKTETLDCRGREGDSPLGQRRNLWVCCSVDSGEKGTYLQYKITKYKSSPCCCRDWIAKEKPHFWLHLFLDGLCIQMNRYFFWWCPLRHGFWGLFCPSHRESVWYVDRCMIMIVLEDEGEEKMCCGQETAISAFLFPPVFFFLS